MSDLDYVLPADGSDDAENNEPDEVIDHVAKGLERLYLQFKKPKIQAWMTILLTPIQEAEEMLAAVKIGRSVDTAVGKHLENIGKKVGQPRTSADNEVYRRHIRARIAVNRSKGTAADVIKVTRAVLGPESDAIVQITPSYPAGLTVTILGEITEEVAEILGLLLPETVSAAVQITVVYTLSPLEDTFTFDVGPGFDIGHLGGVI